MIDMVVDRRELKAALGRALQFMYTAPGPVPSDIPAAESAGVR
jgi:acetyl-CoA carboxylase beta subunit